ACGRQLSCDRGARKSDWTGFGRIHFQRRDGACCWSSVAGPQRARRAVELMDIGWNFRREHIRIGSRVHYVITNGGDQPNVVPSNATVWYYYREADYEHVMNLWKIGDDMAHA